MANYRKSINGDFDVLGNQLLTNGDPFFKPSPTANRVPLANGSGAISGNWMARSGPQVYVSPTGSNSNVGTELAPYKTVAFAYQALWPNGGTINVFSGATWADGNEPTGAWGGTLTSGQGMWVTQQSFARAGWWSGLMPVLIRGVPQVSATFAQVPQANLIAGDSVLAGPALARGDPAFWADFLDGHVQFENIQFGQSRCPVRLGWDYARNSDGTVLASAVTSAVRTGSAGAPAVPSQTVFTLGSVPTYTIVSLSRAGGVTTATITTGSGQRPNVNVGSSAPIHLTSSDGNFPTGDYVVASIDTSTGVFRYVDANSPASASAGAVGTIATHGAGVNDRVTFCNTSGSSQFPVSSTTLKVIAATASTITVTDPYGGLDGRGDGTFANPGNLITELRSIGGYGNLSWRNIGAFVFVMGGGLGGGGFGPALDTALSNGFPLDVRQFNGSSNAGRTTCRNADEGAFLLGDGASYGSSLKLIDGRTGNGNVRVYVQGARGQFLLVDHLIQDSGTGTIPAAVELVAQPNSFASIAQIVLNTIFNSDDVDGDPSAIKLISGLDPSRVLITNVPSFNGGVEGGTFTGLAVDVTGTVGPTALNCRTWDGRRIIGQHDTARRAVSLQGGNRYRNQLDIDLNNWTVSGSVTLTAGEPHPDGVSKAFKLTGTGVLFGVTYNGTPLNHTTFPVAAGDQWIIGTWCRLIDTGSVYAHSIIVMNGVGLTVTSRSGEWQWISGIAAPGVTPDFVDFKIIPNGSTAMWIRDPVMLYIPAASAIDTNELAEIAAHLGPCDANLLPGTVGTGRQQAFQAQGRLLQAKAADQASAGTITIGFGNLAKITTNTNNISFITTTGWQAGSRVMLSLPNGITIVNNAGAPPANTANILLRAGANLVTGAAYLLELVYDGTSWVQPG